MHRHGWAAVALLLLAAGCRQDGAPGLSLPWQRPAPAAPTPADGQAQAPPPADDAGLPLLARIRQRQQERFGYLSDLQRRADAQRALAQQQQQELERLKKIQDDADQHYVARLRELEDLQTKLAEQQRQQEQLFSTRQKETLEKYNQLLRQAEQLDANNRDLHGQLAQAEQRNQVLQDQVALLQQRLSETAAQLATSRRDQQRAAERLSALQASMRKDGFVSVRANNSLMEQLTAVSVPGMDIRQDRDLVRISLSSDDLFQPGTATLKGGADTLIGQAADVILRYYAQQIVGVEAHSDGMPLTGTPWRNHHQLTAAQAMAVFEQLTERYRLPTRQLYVLGHGHNLPRQADVVPASSANNRRVELVIYPERYASAGR